MLFVVRVWMKERNQNIMGCSLIWFGQSRGIFNWIQGMLTKFPHPQMTQNSRLSKFRISPRVAKDTYIRLKKSTLCICSMCSSISYAHKKGIQKWSCHHNNNNLNYKSNGNMWSIQSQLWLFDRGPTRGSGFGSSRKCLAVCTKNVWKNAKQKEDTRFFRHNWFLWLPLRYNFQRRRGGAA